MASNSSKFDIGLNIHLLSFTLPKSTIKQLDEVRVSITTMPDGVKQHYHLQGRKMGKTNHIFSLNITNQTKRIVMVFRKKVLFSDGPIIASKTIHLSEFQNVPETPINTGSINSEVKTLYLYYPLQKQMEEENTNNKNIERKKLGQMDIQLTFTAPYFQYKRDKTSKDNKKNDKKLGKAKASKMSERKDGEYAKIND